MKTDELMKKLKERNEKISKAVKVRSLIQKQKSLWKSKQSLTNFDEPVLFLCRRNGITDIFEKATAGKFVFDHSNGKSRFIELRPSDQQTFPYGDKRIRCYFAHEDRPFAGWDEPIVDSESVMIMEEKSKATDLKYQQALERLKTANRWTWVYILLGLAVAIAIVGFAYMSWIQPALEKKAQADALIKSTAPVAGLIWLSIKRKFK